MDHRTLRKLIGNRWPVVIRRAARLLAILLWTAGLHSHATAADEKPGITLTFTSGEKSDVRTARLVALEVPAGQPPTPFLPAGPFTARWETEIVCELQSENAFAATVQGTVKVSLNGAEILAGSGRVEGKTLKLLKGSNRLVVEYASPAQGDALLRLFWSGKDFAWEPVPPAIFRRTGESPALRAGDLLRRGRLLFAERRCAACHEAAELLPPKGQGMPELAQDAPMLTDFHLKFRETWLAAWIHDPQSSRPHSLMPRVFADTPLEKIDQRAADLAAYFASLGAVPESKPLDESLVPEGGALFANLGCIACHSRPDAEGADEHERTPLTHLRAKWHAPALTEYLSDPQKHYAWTRMPNFRLTPAEAAKLTAYLFLSAKKEFPAGPKGDPQRGAQLLTQSGCLQCHAGVPPSGTPALAATLKAGWTKGCLAADAPARGKAPDFAFTPVDRQALQAFAASGLASLKQEVAIEFAERQIAVLHCNACHTRDGLPSLWSQLDDETAPLAAAIPPPEGEGHPTASTVLPSLTWTGEKLQTAWLADFIAGHIKDKPRPWLLGRMPGFPAVAKPLAEGLALGHGFPVAPTPPAAPDAAKVKAGETLLGEKGGFNCVQCHALGTRAATAPFEAPGPNLTLATTRLRPEYYLRWVLHPQRIDPDTKMPRFSNETGQTPLTEIFGGKAQEQYEAIWAYLQSLPK